MLHSRTAGVHLADSITVDGHKILNVVSTCAFMAMLYYSMFLQFNHSPMIAACFLRETAHFCSLSLQTRMPRIFHLPLYQLYHRLLTLVLRTPVVFVLSQHTQSFSAKVNVALPPCSLRWFSFLARSLPTYAVLLITSFFQMKPRKLMKFS